MLKKKLNNESLKEKKTSKCIICPECQENTRININNFKINLFGCKNNHSINQLLMNDYKLTQNIDKTKIICSICKNINKINTSNDIFRCLNCKQNICELCRSIHDKTHNVIDYSEKFFICDYHYEAYTSYCNFCKNDICSVCEKDHQGHKIVSYEGMLPDMVKIHGETIELNNRKEELITFIKNIINKLNNFIRDIDDWFGIYEDIINSYENKRGNYFFFQNVSEMEKFNRVFIQDINKILDEKNIFHKINNLTDLYYKMNVSNDIYYNTENIYNDRFIDINNKMETPENKIEEYKDEEKSNIIISDNNSDDSLINKTMDVNMELMMISEDNEDDDYLMLDITKMKKILTLKNEKLIFKQIYILKDGRIIIHNNDKNLFLCFIFDLKNDKCYNFNIKFLNDLIQMDDGKMLILTDSEILLINMNEKNFEIIQLLKIKAFKMVKLTDKKFLVIEDELKSSTFIYENKKLVLENQKSLNSLKNIYIMCYKTMQAVNEKELIIGYYKQAFMGFDNCLSFIDLEKDKIIKTLGLGSIYEMNLSNGNILIVGHERKIYSVDIKNHTKKKEFKLEKKSNIHTIVILNEKQILVAQYDYINQFEVDSSYNFKLLHSIELKSNKIYKYPKSRIICKESAYEPKQLSLYG